MDHSQFSHDDVNDIMSMVMGGHAPQQALQPLPRYDKQKYTRLPQMDVSPVTAVSESAYTNEQPLATEEPAYAYTQPQSYATDTTYPDQLTVKNGHGWFYAVLISVILGIFAVVGFYSHTYISALLVPPSPFKDKISQQSFSLFYPTKLPEGYKIELDSIAVQENHIVAFSMSNDRSQRVIFNLQEAPAGLNLAAYEERYSDYKQVATVNGTAKVGVTTEGNEIAHMVAGKTWITVQASKDTLSKEGFATVLSSLKLDSPQ